MPSQLVFVASEWSPSSQKWKAEALGECHDRWGDLHCCRVYLKEVEDKIPAAVPVVGSPPGLRGGYQSEPV